MHSFMWKIVAVYRLYELLNVCTEHLLKMYILLYVFNYLHINSINFNICSAEFNVYAIRTIKLLSFLWLTRCTDVPNDKCNASWWLVLIFISHFANDQIKTVEFSMVFMRSYRKNKSIFFSKTSVLLIRNFEII